MLWLSCFRNSSLIYYSGFMELCLIHFKLLYINLLVLTNTESGG